MTVLPETHVEELSQPPTTPLSPPTRRWNVVRPLMVTIGYLALYLALYRLALGSEIAPHISPWCPAAGMGVALLLIFGIGYAPLLFIGNLLAFLFYNKAGEGAQMAGMWQVFASALGYTATAAALRYGLRIDPTLGRLRDVIYLLLGAFVAPFFVGFLCVAAPPFKGSLFENARNWWVADTIGLMTVMPFLLVHGAPWATNLVRRASGFFGGGAGDSTADVETRDRPLWKVTVELLAWVAVIALVVWVSLYPPIARDYHLAYLAFLLLIWVSLRHGTLGTSATVLGFTLGIILLLSFFKHQTGIAAVNLQIDEAKLLPELQVFLLALSLSGLLLGAVVSERKQSEKAVRENEDVLRTLINAMPDLVAFKDGAGHWVQANEFGRHVLQLDGLTYQGKTDEELGELPAQMRDPLHRCTMLDEDAWQAGGAARNEESIPDGEGTERIFDVIKVPLYHPDGERKGLVIIGRDITERKRAEDELETERAFLSSAVDILPLPLAFYTPQGALMQANSASYAFFRDLPAEQWKECKFLAPETHIPLTEEQSPLTRAFRGEYPPTIESIISIPDGREVPILLHAAPVMVGEKLAAVVVVLQDISALKEADRAKDQFLGILSYELLTPLNDILGWSQAAHDTPEMSGQALEIIGHNTAMLQRILVDLLDISRLIHGKLLLNRTSLDLWELAETCAGEFDQAARDRRRVLVLEAPDDEMPIKADQGRLRQALTILLTTALKSTNPGDSIIVSGTLEGRNAVLVVRDTGRGLAPEALANVFNPFQQDQPNEPGRGLGMALVKGIIELHGGEVTAESPGPNQGTIFTIALPLSR